MNQTNLTTNSNQWTVSDSASLYGLDRWGEEYFSINDQGNISVQPQGAKGETLDLLELIKELEGRNLKSPLLIRLDDILEDRLKLIHEAFATAISQYNYKGKVKI